MLAIVDETTAIHSQGRPALIGTCTIIVADQISNLLTAAGIDHQVLHARNLKKEAAIIAQAGQMGAVTVATNMAGRGTDIKLGAGVEELGGLHVICTELHPSARLDRQLHGRCGRQGDPGSFRHFLALDDEILSEGLGEAAAKKYVPLGMNVTGPLERFCHLFRRAQRRVEREHRIARSRLQKRNQSRNRRYRQMGRDPHLDL